MKLPAIRYWFTSAALSSAGVFLLGTAMGLVQVKPMVRLLALWGFAIIGIALVVLVWYASALQAQDAAIAQKSSAAILDNLSSLVTARQERDEPVDWNKLSQLSNEQLRNAALSLASQMRVFEGSHREREDARQTKEWQRLSTTVMREHAAGSKPFDGSSGSREVNDLWNASQLKDAQSRGAYEKAFKTQYLPKAIAIRDELLARQGLPAPEDYSSPTFSVALDRGMLAGVDPVGDAATVIERLARSLP
jgi:hypothetical protein